MADAVQLADGIIGAVGEVALEAGEAALIAAYPFLGIPGLKQLWEFFVNRLAAYVIVELQKSSNVIIIKMTDAAQGTAADDASIALKKAQDDPNTTPEELANARADFKKKYADLIRTRVATP